MAGARASPEPPTLAPPGAWPAPGSSAAVRGSPKVLESLPGALVVFVFPTAAHEMETLLFKVRMLEALCSGLLGPGRRGHHCGREGTLLCPSRCWQIAHLPGHCCVWEFALMSPPGEHSFYDGGPLCFRDQQVQLEVKGSHRGTLETESC